jgi:hypothetical protein
MFRLFERDVWFNYIDKQLLNNNINIYFIAPDEQYELFVDNVRRQIKCTNILPKRQPPGIAFGEILDLRTGLLFCHKDTRTRRSTKGSPTGGSLRVSWCLGVFVALSTLRPARMKSYQPGPRGEANQLVRVKCLVEPAQPSPAGTRYWQKTRLSLRHSTFLVQHSTFVWIATSIVNTPNA